MSRAVTIIIKQFTMYTHAHTHAHTHTHTQTYMHSHTCVWLTTKICIYGKGITITQEEKH